MKNRATKFFQDYFKLADEDAQSCMHDDTIDCMVKFAEREMNPDVAKMSIEKYKLKLEAAIYESCDKYYIGGKIVEEVLKEYHAEQLNLPPVGNNEVAVIEKTCTKVFNIAVYGDYCKKETCEGCLFFQ